MTEPAGAVTTESVRRAYYEDPRTAGWLIQHIELLPSLALIVAHEDGDSLWRVPVTLTEEQVSFGAAEQVPMDVEA